MARRETINPTRAPYLSTVDRVGAVLSPEAFALRREIMQTMELQWPFFQQTVNYDGRNMRRVDVWSGQMQGEMIHEFETTRDPNKAWAYEQARRINTLIEWAFPADPRRAIVGPNNRPDLFRAAGHAMQLRNAAIAEYRNLAVVDDAIEFEGKMSPVLGALSKMTAARKRLQPKPHEAIAGILATLVTGNPLAGLTTHAALRSMDDVRPIRWEGVFLEGNWYSVPVSYRATRGWYNVLAKDNIKMQGPGEQAPVPITADVNLQYLAAAFFAQQPSAYFNHNNTWSGYYRAMGYAVDAYNVRQQQLPPR
ncbi:MAG: hypothetical protein ACREGI_02815 [Candidatus Levyibacteriota bacterium]